MMEGKNSARRMALGGSLAALAVVIMMLGGIVPMATFCCPILASCLLIPVIDVCGRRLAWMWFGAVAILSMLLCADKEAAGVFLFLGYYPICKPAFDRMPKALRVICKMVLFNLAVVILYAVLIFVMGLEAVASEFREAGIGMLLVMLVLGNAVFLLTDALLKRMTLLYQIKKRKK